MFSPFLPVALSDPPASLIRQCFRQPDRPAAQAADELRTLRLLLAQDGSTTRLCETVAGGPVQLYVPHQVVTAEVPELVRRRLPGSRFIERRVCLAAHGQALMDNLSYIALDGLPPDVRADLEAGSAPIGHLLERLWVRRVFDPMGDAGAEALRQKLWQACGQPDPEATRTHTLHTPAGPLMLITETWRRGMLLARP